MDLLFSLVQVQLSRRDLRRLVRKLATCQFLFARTPVTMLVLVVCEEQVVPAPVLEFVVSPEWWRFVIAR